MPIFNPMTFELSEKEKIWFGNRMDENQAGKILIPTYLYNKFRRLAGDESIHLQVIKDYLITNCY